MFLKHTITATASHTHTVPYKQLCMQACYAANIVQWFAAIKLDTSKTDCLYKSTSKNRMDPYQKRNLTIGTCPKLALKMLMASLVTGNMGLFACAASTIGSLTCRWFYWYKQ